MVSNYTPAYYSTLHDSITSLCRTILPFSFKKQGRLLAAAEHRLNKIQSDNLKWQQDSFHQILKLMGLHKAGILEQHEVSAFRSHLLETIIASPPEQEHSVVLRDKLLFLQELLYAKCITEEEYHWSKRPLLQRLAVQGAEIQASDMVVGGKQSDVDENRDEEWSVIDLKDEKCELTPQPKRKSKEPSSPALKQIKGAGSSLFGFHKQSNRRQSIFEIEAKRQSCGHNSDGGGMDEIPILNGGSSVKESETKTILMQASGKTAASPRKENGSGEKVRRKPFRTLFNKEQSSEKSAKKKQWWKRNDSEDETAPLPLNIGRTGDGEDDYENLVTSPIGEGPDRKQIERKIHSDGTPSDFFVDKVLGNNIKKELSRIQTELSTTNPNLKFSDDQMEAISTKLPVDKADIKNFFPKSWCDQYGDVVLDVVKKEFKDHVGEMENMRNSTREKNLNNSKRWTTFNDDDDDLGEIENMRNATREKDLNNSKRWTTFDDDEDENSHPNLFSSHSANNINKSNPFLQDSSSRGKSHHGIEKPDSVSTSFQNPFWNGSSVFH